MPKKTKSDITSEASTEGVPAVSEPSARPTRKRAAATKSAKTAPKKKPAPRAAKAATKQRPRPAKSTEPSDADIRLRAYFIAERRVQLALQGDPARDWIEAKRQLLEEAKREKS